MVKIRKSVLETLDGNEDDLRAVVSGLHFILKNGVKHAVDAKISESSFSNWDCLKRPVTRSSRFILNIKILLQKSSDDCISVSKTQVDGLESDHVMDTSQSEGVDAPVVQMQLQLTGESDIATAVPFRKRRNRKV